GNGLCRERRAQVTGPAQTHGQRLASEVGIGTSPLFDEGDNVYFHDGERSTYSDKGITGTAPNDPEIFNDIVSVVGKIDQMAREIPVGSPWKAPRAREWDMQ